jgi:HPt (histidine-containing phosphotransfer) domain-containing protein
MNMLYDLTELKSYSNGDKEFEADMFQTFLDQTPEFLKQMDFYLLQNNIVEVGKIAHKFKSSVGIFGMESIRKNLELIENACRINSERAKIDELHNKLKNQVTEVLPLIEQEKVRCND